MNSLSEYIKLIPAERNAYISKDTILTYGDLVSLGSANKKALEILKGSCVVIQVNKRLDFAVLLSVLDGNVKRIVFLPEDISEEQFLSYCGQTSAEYEVRLSGNDIVVSEIADAVKIADDIADTQWVIPTSGTTKTPKLVIHTFASLTRTTKQDISKGSEYVWGLTFDIFRFSGIQVMLQSVLGGSSMVIPESDSSVSAAAELFSRFGCNVISATPSYWRKMLMSNESYNLKLKRITLGGEIVDDFILKSLKNRFENAKIIHIYASTEAGVGFSVVDGRAGFPYDYIVNGVGNINLKISSKNTLMIRPNLRSQKYVEQDNMFDEKGFIDTGDILQVKQDRVYFLGRDSGAINVGGNKVQPEEVEHTLLASGIVEYAYVYAKKSSLMGSLVCADVILSGIQTNTAEATKSLTEFCRNNLEGFKVPAFIKVVKDIAINNNGKLIRK
ncbi:AMP-binding protein [Sphaerochaeta sp.]|uniref:AMP-binding protein n=1 Tax=Sphaerochaeta sp. TaxID=1972642 RepID=UPI003D118C2F